MTWEIINIIGTIAFAASGAIVAMEEEFDVLGVYFLGLMTAFGGGAIRNLLIGIPISVLWDQEPLFLAAIIIITIVFLFPKFSLRGWEKSGLQTDAVGLSAFAINGALYATEMNHSIIAILVAALLTGTGGGMLRDVLAGRKALLSQGHIYGAWAILAGLVVGTGLADQPLELYVLFAVIAILRILTVYYNWSLPFRSLKSKNEAN